MDVHTKVNFIIQALSLRDVDSNGNFLGYVVKDANRETLVNELTKTLTQINVIQTPTQG